MNLAELKCSFCLAGIDKDTGTLGSDAGICHACVNRAADRLEAGTLSGAQRSAERLNDETRCDFCYTSTATSSTLFTNRGHFICAECVALIRKEIIGRALAHVQATTNGVYSL
jgi:hypothetical protein